MMRGGQRQGTGAISPPRTSSTDWVEWVLGLGSSKNNTDRLNPADIVLMNLLPGANGDVILRQNDDRKTIAEWEFRPSLGYAIVAYRAIVKPETRPNIEVTADDFRPVGALMLPYALHLRFASMRNGQWTEAQRITANIKEYKFNDPQNTDQRYHIARPVGTKVTDAHESKIYIAGEDGKLTPTKP